MIFLWIPINPCIQIKQLTYPAKNQGKGAALKTGFQSLNGDLVKVTIDTDGQLWPGRHPPPGGADFAGRGGYGRAAAAA